MIWEYQFSSGNNGKKTNVHMPHKKGAKSIVNYIVYTEGLQPLMETIQTVKYARIRQKS